MENDNHATVSVDDCRLLTLDRHHHENGNLTVVENGKDFPFEVQRVFYIYDVPGGTDRGGHSHRCCHQFIVAVSGSFDLEIDDGVSRRTVTLNRSNIGLYVAPGYGWVCATSRRVRCASRWHPIRMTRQTTCATMTSF